MWWTIAIDVLKALFAGEFKSWWTEHRAKEKAQKAANAPLNNKEEADNLLK